MEKKMRSEKEESGKRATAMYFMYVLQTRGFL